MPCITVQRKYVTVVSIPAGPIRLIRIILTASSISHLLKNSLIYIFFLSNSVIYVLSSIHQKLILVTYFDLVFLYICIYHTPNIMYMFYFCLIYCINMKNR